MGATSPASLWLGQRPLLLASTSATRRALLESAGLPVEVEAPGVDERALEAEAGGLAPAALARRLAEAKALAVARRHPDRVVIGADQVLDLDGESFSKPASRQEAADQLARLAGRRHSLHAAVTLAIAGEIRESFLDSAHLTLRPLDAGAIAAYLDLAGEAVQTSVGAYQVEGLGIHLFAAIEGQHATILGLPLLPLLARLRAHQLLAW